MVDATLSEEEQVEALKKWWKENGRSVVGGLVLGLGAVFGWRYWVDYQSGVAQQASVQLVELNQLVATGKGDLARAQAKRIIEKFQGSTYAVFAALHLAKLMQESGDSEGAVAQLKWSLDNSSESSLQQIVRARLARILVSTGQLDEAEKVVASAVNDSFRGEFAELRGDIARARDDTAAARAAYREALDNQVSNPSQVKRKLDDLAPADNG
ncbi:MAG: tetratricopeptide repeat protein [Gammaproteobacteria bacterium]|nr:tetratricopeptide repeat protein [Gammaproteobacteria bacterium]